MLRLTLAIAWWMGGMEMMAYTPAGASPDAVPYLLFSIVWVVLWSAILVALRGPPHRSVKDAASAIHTQSQTPAPRPVRVMFGGLP